MAPTTTIEKLLPLIEGLPPGDRIRLALLILNRQQTSDSDGYLAMPAREGEFESGQEGLEWDAEGWNGGRLNA